MEGRADPTGKPERAAPQRSSAPRVRLSCEACRARKVKCDKLSPCSSCQRLGYNCVPVERARLPRGRTRKGPNVHGSDKELHDRVAKLEDMLRRVATERTGPSRTADTSPAFNASNANNTENFDAGVTDVENWQNNAQGSSAGTLKTRNANRPRPVASYMGSSFWEDIMQQTAELRNVLDDRLETEEFDSHNPEGFGNTLIGSETPESASNSPQSQRTFVITPDVRRSLCEIYLHNVDPVFKILHRPSLHAYLYDNKPYLDYPIDHQSPLTLAYAVYLAAVCTIDADQCQALFGIDKKTVVADLQKETEAALIKSDFVTTNDLTILQAYILSLVAARSQDQSRRVWTMLSMALRIGQALCLHLSEPPFHVTPFEQEMRRRCWQCIGILDLSASLDRATDPMMQAAWLQAHPPLNINDEDIWPSMEGPIVEKPVGTFTDSTLTLIVAEAQSVARSVAFADFIEMSVKSMSMRHQILMDFRQNVANLLSGTRPDVSDFHRYAKRTATNINGWLQLGCLRPLIRSTAFQPPKVKGDALLRLAATNLQRASEELSDPAMAHWAWFGLLWAPWHGLAVALAELCVCKDPDTMSKYWPVVEVMYHRTSTMIADSEQGMLWRPLKKLMSQASNRKRELLGDDEYAPPLGQFTGGRAPSILTHQQVYTTIAGYEMMEPHVAPLPDPAADSTSTMAVDQSFNLNPSFVMTLPSVETDSWTNFWASMDFSNIGAMPGASEDVGWNHYNNFMGDVAGNGDFMFTPP
ncbi:hypothetical protein N7468_007032 [Penicillium chermesinum]|uniref:Zn(2)-C6 fungal-type domain-containing protein n=1 Tax=Penicillium chermesinum TaxID=63820 RepID=A0A9W9NTB9_9EURO|nr:uncharacterized protein N7468_007032 [Penicillium chermesinum]KAJ5225807.1 hypothetical protein N7468_007032 [Penicillium chermesinum]KAJ6160984.1 hypothetical protein N7470_004380 [Penicillium chermesinum]